MATKKIKNTAGLTYGSQNNTSKSVTEEERLKKLQDSYKQYRAEISNGTAQKKVDEALKRANAYRDTQKKALDAYNKRFSGTGYSNVNVRDYTDYVNRYGTVLNSKDAYKNYLKDLDTLQDYGVISGKEEMSSIRDTIDLRNAKLTDAVKDFTKYYSQYKDKNDYLLHSDSEEAKTERKATYKDNQNRLAEVKEQLDAGTVRNKYNGTKQLIDNLKRRASTMNEASEEYETTWQKIRQLERDNYERSKDLDALAYERDRLQKDILMYERSDAFAADSYDDLKNNADYSTLSKKRDQNKGYRDSDALKNMLDTSMYTTDMNGNTYDVYGNLVTEERRNALIQQNQVQDKLGMYLNATESERQKAASDEDRISGTKSEAINEGIIKYWNELNEDEINNYYYLYNKEGKESAEKYLDSLEVTLGRRNNEKQQEAVANANGLEHVWLATKSVIGNVLGGAIAGTENIVRTIEGKEINPYSVWQSGTNYSSNVRGYQAEAIDRAVGNGSFLGISLGDVYQSVMSAVDSAVGGALLGGVGYGASMGLGAMASTAKDLYEQGATTEQIFFGSLLSGIAEETFETLSIERLLAIKDTKSIKTWIINILKQSGTEASEEVFTEIANKLTDMAVRGRNSETLQAYYQYKEQGLSDGAATLAALKDAGIDIYKAGVGGFISGGLGAGVRGGMQLAGYQNAIYNQGRADFRNGNYQNILSQAQDLSQTNQRIADRYSAAQERISQFNEDNSRANERRAGRAVGKLSQSIDSQRRAQNIADIQKALKDNGVKGNLYSKAEAINDAIDRGTIGEEYSKIIDRDPKVRQVYDAFKTGDRSELVNRNREYLYNTNGIVTDDQGNIDEQATIDKRLNNIGNTIADRARIAQKTFDVKVNDNDTKATIDHIDDSTVYLKTADGKVVSSEDIEADNDIKMLLENAPAFGMQGAKSYINGYDGKIPVSDYTTAFTLAVMRSTPGIIPQESIIGDAVKAGLSESSALAAYYIGQNLKQYMDTDQVEAMLNYTNTVGRNEILKTITDVAKGEEAYIENVSEEETELDKRAIKEDNVTYNTDRDKLSKATQRQIKAIGLALRSIGRNVVIEDHIDYVDDKNRVYYDAANAYFDKKDNTYHISKNVMDKAFFNIAVHETVHDIAANNPEGFNKLKDVVNKYIDSGLYNRETNEMEARNKSELADSEEMIANITSSILSDPDTFTKFADRFITDEESRGIFLDFIDSVAEFIRDAIDKIKNKLGWQQIKVLENNLTALEEIRDAYFEGLEGVRDAQPVNTARLTIDNIENQTEAERENLAELSRNGIEIDETGAANVRYSWRTFDSSQKAREDMVNRLVEAGFDRAYSEQWLEDINSVYALVMNDLKALDYKADSRYSWLKKNSDYTQGSVDFNNNCPKRVEFTALCDRLFKEFPNTVLTADDFEALRQVLIKNKITVTCGICFVEDRRQGLSTVVQTYIDQLKDGSLAPMFKNLLKGDTYIPTQYDLITYDGYYDLYKNHRGVYESFRRYNNHRGMASIRLLEGMGEYNNEIRKWTKRTITSKNNKGGLRIFSTSDADPRILLDIMQIVNDAAAKGLQIQGYTKKPWFAKLVRNTGIRLLQSHIPSGIGYETVDGRKVLTFDNREGINTRDPDYLDTSDSLYIGNNVIGINDEQIRIAMTDPMIDQIIPFHSNQSKAILEAKGISHYKNYKTFQTDKKLSDGTVGHQINLYTEVIREFERRGQPIKNKYDFVNAFLQVCKEKNLKPRFSEFLNTDANGDYVYTEGYHKFLVDYKMFDKNGNYIPQVSVTPAFDMEVANATIKKYVKMDEYINKAVAPEVKEKAYQEMKEVVQNKLKFSVNTDSLGNQLTEEQDNYFADSKIRDNNGNLKVMYHGTNADFNIFDQLNFGEVGDTAEGFGIYLTDTREVADSYGGRIIEAYANVTRPASKNAKTIKRAELVKLIKATCENEAKSLMEDGYDSIEDALKDTWVSNYTYTYDKPMNAVYNQVAADILRMNDNDMDIVQEVMSGMAIRDYAKAYEFYPLLTETMGIDGFETTWEDSRDPENPAHIVVAFNSEQVKNIDNKTPTSNPDIRYSANQDAIDQDEIHQYLENINSQIKQDMSQEERYEILKDARIPAISFNTDRLDSQLSDETKDAILRRVISKAEPELKKYLRDNRIINSKLTAPGVEYEFEMSGKGVAESLQKQKNYSGTLQNLVYALDNIDAILESAVLINKHSDKYKGTELENERIKSVSVLMGMMDNGETLIPVKMDIKEYTDIPGRLYVTVTTGEIKKVDVRGMVERNNSNTPNLVSTFTYNIQEVIKNVKQQDRHLLKYFPDQMLTDDQLAWKNDAIKEDIASVKARAKNVPDDFTISYAVNPDSIDLSSLNNSDDKNLDNFKNTVGTQYKLNIAKKLTPEVADKMAGRILREYHSSYAREELSQKLTALINDAARQGKDLDVDTFINQGAALLSDVLEKSTEFNQEAYDADDKVRSYLNGIKIKLTSTQEQEVTSAFESVRAYRAGLFGSAVKINQSTGISLDVIWGELSALNPVLFPADASEGDMPMYLADAAQMLKKANYYFNPYGFDAEGMGAIIFADMVADYADDTRIKTVVNQMKAYGRHYFSDTMKDLNRRTRERATQQKAHTEKLKADLARVKEETRKYLNDMDELILDINNKITQAEYEMRALPAGSDRFDYEQTIAGLKKTKERYEYSVREWKRQQTEEAQRLQKEIEESAKNYLKAGGKGINYAMDARQAVIRTRSLVQQKQLKEQAQRRTVINTVRRNANNLLGRLLNSSDTRHVPENLRIPVATFLQNLDLGFTGEESNAAVTWIENIGKLADKMRNFNEANGTFQVDDMIIEQLNDIASDLRIKLETAGKRLSDMSLYELQQLRDTVSLINAAIYNSDRLLADGRKQRASSLAERSINEMAGKKQRKHTKGILKMAGDFFGIDQLDSFSYAERLGSDFNNVIFKNLRKGFDTKVKYVQQGNEAFAEALKKLAPDEKTAKRLLKTMSGDNAVSTAYMLESGNTLTLTPAQVMELYLLNNREDARRHIYNGGITVMEYGKGKNTVKKQEMVQVTEGDVKNIIDTLSPQQKAFADAMQKFAATSISEWGNNVSMTLWGIKKFTDPNYWKIRSDSNTLNAIATEKNSPDNVGLYHLKNLGSSKATNPLATNPLIVGDAIDSFVSHVDEMSSYGAYTVPLDDAMKWYNYKNGNRTTQRAIENYMGVAGKEYFTDFIKTLNSSQPNAGGMPILDKLISNAKVAAIAANLRVVIQQPSAYARAMDVIDPKYLVQTGNPKTGAEEAQKYCSIAAWKNWGFRDADIGRSLRDVMVGDTGSLAQRINEVTGKPAGWADDVTWGAIWNAVKAEVKDKNPQLRIGTQEFYDAVSERFTEVIDKTQVVDSPFHRSKGMRSKNMLWKMATAFMSEPTKSYNMFYRTVSDAYQNGVNARTVKRIGRATVSFVTATVLNTMLASIIDAIRHRDDDDDKDFWDRYLSEAGQNLLDGLNPLNLIPIGKDIMSMIDGYSPSRLDLDAMNSLIQTGKKALQLINGEGKNLNGWRIAYDLIGDASKVTGIPAGNMLRTVDSIAKMFGANWFGKYNEWASSKQTAGSMYTEYKKTGKWTEDLLEKYVSMKTDEVIKEEEQRELEGHNRKYATTEDVTRYATNQVYGNFASMLAEDDERIAEAYEAKVSGNSATVTRLKKVFTDAGIPGEIFDKAVLVYGNNLEESDPKSIKDFGAKLYDTDDLAEAIVNGYDTDDIYNEIISDSTAQDPEKSTVNSTMKKLEGYYQQYMLDGNTRKAEQIIDNAQKTFELDDSRFESWSKSVDYLQFSEQNPNVSMSQDDYQRYQKVASSGITPETWMQYYEQASTMKADVDSNGEAISGSRKKKVLVLIDSLPITDAQKDALYYYNNWAESTIKEAPWH